MESLNLLTAPLSAVVGLLLVVGGLSLGTLASLVPKGSSAAARALVMARWPGDLEWWRIGTVRSRAGGTPGAGGRPGSRPESAADAADAADPGVWLDLAAAVAGAAAVADTVDTAGRTAPAPRFHATALMPMRRTATVVAVTAITAGYRAKSPTITERAGGVPSPVRA